MNRVVKQGRRKGKPRMLKCERMLRSAIGQAEASGHHDLASRIGKDLLVYLDALSDPALDGL